MASLFWAAKLVSRLIGGVASVGVGIARVVLRGVISIAVKLEEKLPDIVDTMKEVDPGQTYADWAQQYRSEVQGLSLEQRLATWPGDVTLDSTVVTWQNYKRARKYRYIFAANVIDDKMGTNEWKMFSMYSNRLMSPDELQRSFQEEYFSSKYENDVRINSIILKRVQQWTKAKTE